MDYEQIYSELCFAQIELIDAYENMVVAFKNIDAPAEILEWASKEHEEIMARLTESIEAVSAKISG